MKASDKKKILEGKITAYGNVYDKTYIRVVQDNFVVKLEVSVRDMNWMLTALAKRGKP